MTGRGPRESSAFMVGYVFVTHDTGCQDILTQVAAARAALAAVALGLLDSEPHRDRPADADEVLVAVERLVRL